MQAIHGTSQLERQLIFPSSCRAGKYDRMRKTVSGQHLPQSPHNIRIAMEIRKTHRNHLTTEPTAATQTLLTAKDAKDAKAGKVFNHTFAPQQPLSFGSILTMCWGLSSNPIRVHPRKSAVKKGFIARSCYK